MCPAGAHEERLPLHPQRRATAMLARNAAGFDAVWIVAAIGLKRVQPGPDDEGASHDQDNQADDNPVIDRVAHSFSPS